MKPKFEEILTNLYQVDYAWQQYVASYTDKKTVFTKKNRKEKLKLLEEEYLERQAKYKKAQQKVLGQAVQRVSQYEQALHESTIKIREVKQGIKDALTFYEESKRREEERLEHYKEGNAALKEFIPLLKAFITEGAPSLTIAPVDISAPKFIRKKKKKPVPKPEPAPEPPKEEPKVEPPKPEPEPEPSKVIEEVFACPYPDCIRHDDPYLMERFLIKHVQTKHGNIWPKED